MSICVVVGADGVISRSAQTLEQCDDFVLVSVDEHSWVIQAFDINPQDILEVFGIAFGWVVFMSFLAYKIRIARKVIKLT